MILKIFTKEDAPEMRRAKEIGENIEGEGHVVEYFEADQPNTVSQAQLYDIYSYPSFVVTAEDGTVIETWRGEPPLESDLKFFLK